MMLDGIYPIVSPSDIGTTNMTRKIDLTPTWEQAMHMCLVLLENSATEEGKQTARNEIIRCGQLLDLAKKREQK